jgi:hypothetical protein
MTENTTLPSNVMEHAEPRQPAVGGRSQAQEGNNRVNNSCGGSSSPLRLSVASSAIDHPSYGHLLLGSTTAKNKKKYMVDTSKLTEYTAYSSRDPPDNIMAHIYSITNNCNSITRKMNEFTT